MFTGFAGIRRNRLNRAERPDGEPAENVHIRTKPHNTDGVGQAYPPFHSRGVRVQVPSRALKRWCLVIPFLPAREASG